MNSRSGEFAIVGAGLAYLATLGWAIGNVSYDIWGALIVVPIYGLIGAAIVQRMFRGSLRILATAMTWGLVIKLGGALARYWVGFEAYGGSIDADRYHDYAITAAGKVWSGEASFVSILPSGSGTAFLERFTAFVYFLTGSSQLAGFITFSFLAYVGTVLIVKAAVIAVPGMAARRYAWLCVLFPSIVFWPASIGKEAAIMLGLGVATLGVATMLTAGRWLPSIALIAVGLGFTSLIRPHLAGIWIAGALPAMVVALARRSRTTGDLRPRKINKFGIVVMIAIASVFLAVIAGVTTRYLAPAADDVSTTDSLTLILEETTRRTSEAGSNFVPPSVSSPLNWPYASLRTLSRPLPQEARGVAQLVAAAEISVLIVIYILSRRRLYNVPRLIVDTPYVTFAVTTLFLAGLAYSSFANLGVLTRQKSLLFPLLLLLPCVPARTGGRSRTPDRSNGEDDKRIAKDESIIRVSPLHERSTELTDGYKSGR